MSVSVAILNTGNHPDDEICVMAADTGAGHVTLMAGDSVVMKEDLEYSFRVLYHGSGDQCRTHEAMAIMTDGPGAELVRLEHTGADRDAVHGATIREFKKLQAAFINLLHVQGGDPRCTALAKTAAEEAAMWAEKAVTAKV